MNHLIGKTKQPLVCTPLVAKSKQAILQELREVLIKKPDIVEWRADFFAAIANTAEVVAVANSIKEIAGEIPVIFTIRSLREGGQPIPLTAEQAIELNIAICQNTKIEYVDCELSNLPAHIERLQSAAAVTGTKIIGSYHNFSFTPEREELAQKFAAAEAYRLDVAKVAVMPQNLQDVLTMLSATLEAKAKHKIPLITMSMGKYGAISRMVGGVFGSSLTFGVGSQASAPGQVPIEDLKTVLAIVEKTIGGE
ncbi:MAG: type I 3-dehydroquinate dehydratase [Negativicutes bacterium]|nr:type I 3-dehydroquinate dehydratase [Negativicutes bacterium]